MLGRCVILWVTVVGCLAVPKASTKRELQQLVRLPVVQFPAPLEFQRRFGFTAFPDDRSAALEVGRMFKEEKEVAEKRRGDGALSLRAARIFDSQGDAAGALRQYSRAVDLFRKRLEVSPREARSLAGLGEALAALGRFTEAQAVLDRGSGGADDSALWLARARLCRERAWFSAAGEAQRYATSSFLDQLVSMVANSPEPARVEDSKRFLRLAEEALAQSFEIDSAPEFERLMERAAFRSFQNALETAYGQIQSVELKSRALRSSIFTEEALNDLAAAAELSGNPSVIAAAALASAVGNDLLANWTPAGITGGVEVYARRAASRLQRIAAEAGEDASEAAEFLGCLQVHYFKDPRGAQRSFRQALSLEPGRNRSWELLTLASAYQGPEQFVEAAEERALAFPHPRSSVLLVKSYERQGDTLRAEWTALNAAGTYPDDALVHLTLAAMLLKDENAENVLWRVGEALNKAEKQMGANPKRQARIDFVLVKSVYLALSDQTEEARKLVKGIKPLTPDLQEVLRVLEN